MKSVTLEKEVEITTSFNLDIRAGAEPLEIIKALKKIPLHYFLESYLPSGAMWFSDEDSKIKNSIVYESSSNATSLED